MFYTVPISYVSEIATQLVFILVPQLEEEETTDVLGTQVDVSKSNMEGALEGYILTLFLA